MSDIKYLFLDRDGTLIEEPADFQIDSFEKFRLIPEVIPSLLTLKRAGYRFVMVTNQDGLGTPAYCRETFDQIQKLLLETFATQGVCFESVLVCPHREEERCSCRKPQIQMLLPFISLPNLDRKRSFVIGDRETDLQLAANMAIPGIKITSENTWPKIVAQVLGLNRRAQCSRKTKETEIEVRVILDPIETDRLQVRTGIGFFDHMLEQLACHSGMCLNVSCKGDLHIDDHHTVEDVGIALGAALRDALGDKIGIERFGFFLPMDDSTSNVTLDLSGRAFFKFEGEFSRPEVGGLSTEMVPHFFRSLAEGLAANIHIQMRGENTHHQVESIFKAVGRSLRSAITQRSGVFRDSIPSTKGVL